MRLIFWCLLFFVGCVPAIQYQQRRQELSASQAERNELTKRVAACEYENQKLRDKLKAQPPKAATPEIDAKELEEIKKKALQETEHQMKQKR